MPRTKLVNGNPVPLSAEEEAARDAEEAALAPRPTQPPPEVNVIYDVLLTKGVITQAEIDAAKTKLAG